MTMSLLLTQLLNGLQLGVLLFLLAAGLTLVFGVLKILNIAHGSFYALGAYAAATFVSWFATLKLAPSLSLVAMFGGEWLLRYRLHPEFERSSVADAIRAYRQAAAGPHTPPREVHELREAREARDAREVREPLA